jgi:DNA-directed RNA polymerase specialized sigma24 family protein
MNTGVRVRKLLERFYVTDGPAADTMGGEIVACVRPCVRAFLAGRGARRDDLEDLCQETGVHLFHALRLSRAPGGKPIENGVAFARIIADNLSKDAFRHKGTQPWTYSIEALVEESNRNPDGVLPASPDDVAAMVLSALSAEHLREQLWQVVCQLPPLQRAALLLGMERDELLTLQIKQSEVAKALAIPLPEFLAVWRGLPLSDPEIARRLGIARSGKTTAEGRVSNLRKCARDALRRRLAGLNP